MLSHWTHLFSKGICLSTFSGQLYPRIPCFYWSLLFHGLNWHLMLRLNCHFLQNKQSNQKIKIETDKRRSSLCCLLWGNHVFLFKVSSECQAKMTGLTLFHALVFLKANMRHYWNTVRKQEAVCSLLFSASWVGTLFNCMWIGCSHPTHSLAQRDTHARIHTPTHIHTLAGPLSLFFTDLVQTTFPWFTNPMQTSREFSLAEFCPWKELW